ATQAVRHDPARRDLAGGPARLPVGSVGGRADRRALLVRRAEDARRGDAPDAARAGPEPHRLRRVLPVSRRARLCRADREVIEMRRLFLVAAAAALVRPAAAGEIVLPGTALERDAAVAAVYRTGSKATGRGTLELRWTDAHGRVVDDRKLPVELTDETDV